MFDKVIIQLQLEHPGVSSNFTSRKEVQKLKWLVFL